MTFNFARLAGTGFLLLRALVFALPVILLALALSPPASAGTTGGTSSSPVLTWGDVDCSGAVNPVDALRELQADAGISFDRPGGCPAIGAEATLNGRVLLWGDVDCGGTTGPVDALKLLQFDAGISPAAATGCPPIGQADVVVPEPPEPLALPAGTPEEQAAFLASATSDESVDDLPAWLTAYDAFDVPAFGPDGEALGTTGDDPVGVPFWRLWYVSRISTEESNFSLTDIARSFGVSDDENAPAFDAQAAGEALLDDLRTGATSDDPQVKLFALFVLEVAQRQPAAVDPLDSSVIARDVMLPADLSELVSWVAIRGLAYAEGQAEAEVSGSVSAAGVVPVGAGEPEKCAAAVGTEDATRWLNFIVGQIGAGIQLPGMSQSTDGFVKIVQDYLGVSEDTIERTGKVTARVNAVTSALTLAMLIAGLDVVSEISPDPLERTKSSYTHGKNAEIFHVLTFNASKLPDGNNAYACLASFLLNAFGVTFNFPAEGPIPNSEMEFDLGLGKASCPLCTDNYVVIPTDQFENGGRFLTTDDYGMAVLEVQGHKQAREIPDSAEPWDRQFSVKVSAQPEAITGDHIFDAFFAGFSSPNPFGFLQAVIISLKAKHWDLGEFTYPIRDWRQPCAQSTFAQVTKLAPQAAAGVAQPACSWQGTTDWSQTQDLAGSGHRATTMHAELTWTPAPEGFGLSFGCELEFDCTVYFASGTVQWHYTYSYSSGDYHCEDDQSGSFEVVPPDTEYWWHQGLFVRSGENGMTYWGYGYSMDGSTGMIFPTACEGSLTLPHWFLAGNSEHDERSVSPNGQTIQGTWTNIGQPPYPLTMTHTWEFHAADCNPTPEPICTLETVALPE